MSPKDFRKFCGLSQSDLAKLFNISVQSVRNKENGRVNYSRDEMIILKNLVEKRGLKYITIDDIFFD